MKFFRDRRTTHLRTPLEHERLESGFSEIEGGNEAVVSSADDDYIASLGHLCGLSVFENFERCQASGRSHDSAAGMRRRAAQVKILDRRAKCSPSRDRPQEKQLFERKLALEDVAFGQSPLTFKIERRDDLAVQNDVFDIGRVFSNRINDSVAESFFLSIPI